ncbi:hypothetical protein BaRGS_00035775 [Batillaria attramentaria]|uniref:Uncharacterized protein n=1 Tax=Batillaria attramentaria TaxID=370345 RepID=A0ABD0JEK6_9CAEN
MLKAAKDDFENWMPEKTPLERRELGKEAGVGGRQLRETHRVEEQEQLKLIKKDLEPAAPKRAVKEEDEGQHCDQESVAFGA